MNIGIYIPWRGSGCRYRLQNMQYVRDTLTSYELGRVSLCDSAAEKFHRAGVRNLCAQHALGERVDVMVLCDADTLPERDALVAAIKGAYEQPVLHLPYTQFVGLTKEHSFEVITGTAPVDDQQRWLETATHSIGGVWVMRPDAWHNAEGMDEGFTGWGWEDNAFHLASNVLNGQTVRHEGNIYHLWHPRPADLLHTPQYRANKRRFMRMQRVSHSPHKLRAFLKEAR